MRKRNLTLLFIFMGLVLVVGVLAIYAFFTHRVLYVPGPVMMNTVIPGDRVLARKFSGEVKRGQIIVHQYPGDSTLYLGRVIGMPNETLELRDTNVVINNNQRLTEQVVTVASSHDSEPELRELSADGKGVYKVYYKLDRFPEPELLGPYKIPAGHYFVMGDNRDDCEDSRHYGTVPRELIWGEAFRIYFSTEVTTDKFRWDRLFKKIR